MEKKIGNTIGEKRLRIVFDYSNNDLEHQIKQKAAELINLCEEMKATGKDARCASIAQTEFESGSRWAVRAIFE